MKWSKYNFSWSQDETFFHYNSIYNTILITEKELQMPFETEIQAQLEENGFLLADEIQEESVAKQKIEEKLHSSDTLSCWIFVTNDCNLACPYCFEKDSLSNSRPEYMDKEMCERTVIWLTAKARELNVKKIHVTLTGGEPLMNVPAMEMIAALLRKTELIVTMNVITNGVLLDRTIAKQLYQHNISSYQITIDGPSKIHDARRQYKDGSGTFSTILNNILKIRQWNNQICFVIRINVDQQNYKEIIKLLTLLKKLQLEKFLAICMNDTITDGMPHPDVLSEIVKIILQAQADGFNIAFGELNNCWMMSEYWYMVNVNGDIYKCPSLVGRKQYCVGNVESMKLTSQYQEQMNLAPWESCMNCNLVGLCCGGCPYRCILNSTQSGHKKVCRKDYLEALLKIKYKELENKMGS